MMSSNRIPGSSSVQKLLIDADLVAARKAVREAAVHLELSLINQTKLVTAASELARNTILHGGGGEVRIALFSCGPKQGIKLRFIDEGPGIANLERAMADGYTSGTGLGLGLGGSKRLTDEFRIESEVGKGTTITVVKWK